MKKYLVFAMVLVLAVVLVSPVSVSAKTKAGAKPGSFFYFFDKAIEKTSLFFTFNPEKKAKKALENAEERLAEAEELEKEKEEKEALEIKKEETKETEKSEKDIEKTDNKLEEDLKEEESKETEIKDDKKEESNKKDEQSKEIEKLKKEVEELKQIAPKQPTLEIQNSQEQNKSEEVKNNAEETTKKLATENLQKEQEEKQKELERQQQLENQRLVEEKAKVVAFSSRDITPSVISQIRTQISKDTKNYIIEWSTNEPTLGKVNFGGQMSCSLVGCEDAYSSFRILKQNESYSLNHQIIIDMDLEPATEYKYYIYAIDEAGNETGFYDGKITTELPSSLPELNGQYNIDVVLTKDKSPYFVMGNVFINKKLQIEPGVKIKFNGAYKLVVNRIFGEIRVGGTKNEPVLFEFNNISNGIHISSNNDNVIDNAIVELASTRAISIDSGQNGTMANATISNSTIRNNPVGVWVNNSTAKIINSIISQNSTGVHSVFNSRVEISQNDIFNNNHIALSFETGSIPQLKFNNIYNNKDIIRIHAHSDLKLAVISQNNISLENNKGNIFFGSEITGTWQNPTGEINAQNNWWGATDISVIAQRIKEYHDTSFIYQPFATAEFAGAGVQ